MIDKILLVNMAGTNLGDNSILASMIADLNEQHGLQNVELVNAVADPDVAKAGLKYESQCEWVNLGNPVVTIKHVIESDIIIFGGGGIISDDSNWKDTYLLGLLLLGYYSGSELWIHSLGVDVPTQKYVRTVFGLVCRRASRVSGRDAQSVKNIREMAGIEPELVVDPGLSLPNDAYKTTISFSSNEPKPRVAVNFRFIYKHGDGIDDEFLPEKGAEILEILGEQFEYDCEFHFVPIGIDTSKGSLHSNDINFAEDVKHQLHPRTQRLFNIRSDIRTPNDAMDVIRHCDAVLGMRLHSIVFAEHVQKPFTAISYDNKVRNFAELVENPQAVVEPEADPEEIADSFWCTYKESVRGG